jgi:transposase
MHGIHWDFISSTRFQKVTHLMPSTAVLIFSQNFFRSQVDGRRFIIHPDNVRPRTARKCRAFCAENRFRLAVHLPYSPDLAPSGSFSSDIKHCLQEIAFPSCEELLGAIHETVGAIPRANLGGSVPALNKEIRMGISEQ